MIWAPQGPRRNGDQVVRAVTLPEILFELNALFIPCFQQSSWTKDPLTPVHQTGSALVNHYLWSTQISSGRS